MSIPTLVTDGRRRAVRYVWIVVAFTATAAVVVELVVGFGSLGWGRFVGADYRIYMDAATRWLSGGSYFLPHQLGGPYDLQIAAIALAHRCTLVTNNTQEFSRVPGLRIEDWELP